MRFLIIICLFRNVYNMVLHKFGEKLYSGLVKTVTAHLRQISQSIEAAQGDSFLEVLNRKWVDYNKALKIIRDILMYMDRTYVPKNRKTPVHELGLNLWRDVVINSNETKTRLLDTLLDLMLRERNGEVINRGLMRNLIKMPTDLGLPVYQNDFENRFLEVSANFYSRESEQFIESCACGDYLKKVERRLNEERERVSHYLDPNTESKIISVVEKKMIENHMLPIVHMENSGLVNMLMDKKYDDLERMFNLFRRVPSGLKTIKDVMTSFIRDTGKQLIMDPEWLKNPVDVVQRLLDLKDIYEKVITIAFNNNMEFQNALNFAFDYIINLNAQFPEFISLFVDYKFRRGVSDEDVEILLDKVMMLLRYVQEKDVLEKYCRLHLAKRLLDKNCRQHLAKRLLSEKTESYEAERILNLKLKIEFGCLFTFKLEAMIRDMMNSNDMMKGFLESHGAKLEGSPTLSVRVLTTCSWPTQSSPQCNLPSEILDKYEMFCRYYLDCHTGRRMSWKANMGTADINATFGKGQKHELNVSTHQMCVLMLFNDADRLTCKEIAQATAIPMSELKRCLWSLALVKGTNVLRKEPVSKNIADDDAFVFNDKFTSNHFKIRIGTFFAKRESEPESRETRKRVEEERKVQIEATIVRVMKSRRTLEHDNIIAEVTKQLQARFLPNPFVIEKQIESLIEREYLQRDEVDRKMYHYLA